MVSADHGDMMGDHQLAAKHIWYEGSIGIPLMISGGGLKPRRTRELVSGEEFQGHKSIMTMAFPSTQERIDEFAAKGLDFMDYGWCCIVTEPVLYGRLSIYEGANF